MSSKPTNRLSIHRFYGHGVVYYRMPEEQSRDLLEKHGLQVIPKLEDIFYAQSLGVENWHDDIWQKELFIRINSKLKMIVWENAKRKTYTAQQLLPESSLFPLLTPAPKSFSKESGLYRVDWITGPLAEWTEALLDLKVYQVALPSQIGQPKTYITSEGLVLREDNEVVRRQFVQIP